MESTRVIELDRTNQADIEHETRFERLEALDQQFMRVLIDDKNLKQQIEAALFPSKQYERAQPGNAALFFIAQQINFAEEPIEAMQDLLKYLVERILIPGLESHKYRGLRNCMKLLEALTLSLTSIRLIEELWHHQPLMDNLCVLGSKQIKDGGAATLFSKPDKNRTEAISVCLKLIQMWSDITMVYQGDFPELWECYRQCRLAKSLDKAFNCHNYDQVRLVQQNLNTYFVDIPVLTQQENFIGEKDWALESREYEGSIAFARSFMLRLMVTKVSKAHGSTNTGPAEVDKETMDKMTFLYHYLMNFRSRFSRELKVKVRRRWITEEQHEAGNKQISDVSASLKESKQTMDRLRIVILNQKQYAIDRHQRWQHPWEIKDTKERECLVSEQILPQQEEQIITTSLEQRGEGQGEIQLVGENFFGK